MLRNLFRIPRANYGFSVRGLNRRSLSYVSVHSVFPATLYRFQVHRESKLYDRALEQDDWEYEDGVEVSSDGLVHPEITMDGTFYLFVPPFFPTYNRPSFKWVLVHA